MARFSKLAGEPWPGPGAAWWQGFEAATEPYLHSAEPKELVRLLKLLSTQQQHMPLGQRWLTTFLEASKACLLHMAGSSPSAAAAASAAADTDAAVDTTGQQQLLAARNLGNLAKGLTGLGVLPDEEWLQAWHAAVEVAGQGWSHEVASSLRRRQREFDQLASLDGVVAGAQNQIVFVKQPRVGRRQRYKWKSR
jgi:hypothetical protein